MKGLEIATIKSWIQDTLQIEHDFVLEYPVDMSHGDLATNVALIQSKQIGKNPKEVASDFVKKLEVNQLEGIVGIEIAGPGFINFRLSPQVFADHVFSVNAGESGIIKNENLTPKNVIIEYTDPNPFKEFHIGHLMSNSIGEALSRIIEAEGAHVVRVSYGGDVGLHVAKAIFGVLSQKDEIEKIKTSDTKQQLKFWAGAYVYGSAQYEENEEAKKEIDTLNRTIFDKSDTAVQDLYEWGRRVSIEHFQNMFARLGTEFSRNYWESEVVSEGLKTVEEGLEKGVFEKSEGAVIFQGEKYSLHTRVFVNSKGVPTYEAKELGLGVKKIEDFHFDQSIVITGNEQNDYFKVLLCAMNMLRPEVSGKTTHIGHGMLRFAEGKMSSRKGNVITAENLIDEVKNLVLQKMADRDMTLEVKNIVAEQVAVGAVKYSILKQSPGKDIIFDFEKSLSFEGDSGPYLQYATVRAQSVLKKVPEVSVTKTVPEEWQTTDLERLLFQFGNVIARAGADYSPQHVATYLVRLASEFNSFYASHKIIDDTPESPYKITLTHTFAQVMKTGLNLLGIAVPDQM